MKVSVSKNAQIVLEKRYLKKNHNGKAVETPEDLFSRVAKSIAAADTCFDPKVDTQATERKYASLS